MSAEVKTKTVLEVKSNDFLISLSCDSNCTLGAIYDALCQMQNFVVERINQAQPKKEEKPEEDKIEQIG